MNAKAKLLCTVILFGAKTPMKDDFMNSWDSVYTLTEKRHLQNSELEIR